MFGALPQPHILWSCWIPILKTDLTSPSFSTGRQKRVRKGAPKPFRRGSSRMHRKRAVVAGTSSAGVSGCRSTKWKPAGPAISAVSISRLPVRHPE
jgi:hypothetical protein